MICHTYPPKGIPYYNLSISGVSAHLAITLHIPGHCVVQRGERPANHVRQQTNNVIEFRSNRSYSLWPVSLIELTLLRNNESVYFGSWQCSKRRGLETPHPRT